MMKVVIHSMNKKTIIFIIFGAVILISLGLIFNTEVKSEAFVDEKKVERIQVKLTGAVYFPGEYEVESGITLAGVIGLAGGLSYNASVDSLNLAEKITESKSIHFETSSEPLMRLTLSPFETGKEYVGITGAVKNPGVYEIKQGMTIYDVIMRAGGVSADADLEKVLLYDEVKDQMMIRIPKLNASSSSGNTQVLINLNLASVEELTTLKGIGKAKAEAIINYRNQNGSFKSVDELLKISGIGDGIFNQIKDFLTV